MRKKEVKKGNNKKGSRNTGRQLVEQLEEKHGFTRPNNIIIYNLRQISLTFTFYHDMITFL